MSKLRTSDLLAKTRDPFFVRAEKTDKHNEITVCVMSLAIPVRYLAPCMSEDVLEAVLKVAKSFPESKLRFNFNREAPAFLFSVKGKTECRGNDTPNQKIGDAVALHKALARAFTITKRVVMAVKVVKAKELAELDNKINFFEMRVDRELAYVKEEQYLKLIEEAPKSE